MENNLLSIVYFIVCLSMMLTSWLSFTNRGLKSELTYFKKVYKETLQKHNELAQYNEKYRTGIITLESKLKTSEEELRKKLPDTEKDTELDTLKRQVITYMKICHDLKEELTILKIKNLLESDRVNKPLLIMLIGDLNQLCNDTRETLEKLTSFPKIYRVYTYTELYKTIIPTGDLFINQEWSVLKSSKNMITIARPCNRDIAHTLYSECKNKQLTTNELNVYAKTLKATKD